MRSSKTAAEARRVWEPPALTRLAIGTETKSSAKNELGAEAPGPDKLADPGPPAAPATKLGFSFEWAFPLSARID
jgi:hypothetical protein